jgi:hypothetical protein
MSFDWDRHLRRTKLCLEGRERGAETRKLRNDPVLTRHPPEHVRARRTAALCADCFKPLAPEAGK